jgi:hypothetical protein
MTFEGAREGTTWPTAAILADVLRQEQTNEYNEFLVGDPTVKPDATTAIDVFRITDN